jgi:hypothetical protein
MPSKDGRLSIPPSSLTQTPVLTEEVFDWSLTHAQDGYDDEDVDTPARERKAAGDKAGERGHSVSCRPGHLP